MIVKRKTVVTKLVSAGTDQVVAWAPIPDGGKLLSVQGELHIIGAEGSAVNQLSGYGFSGEVVPIRDPDSAQDINSLWDQMVTKPVQVSVAAGANSVDADWDTSDGAPDTEPGEVDVNQLLGLLESTREIFAPRLEWMSFAKGAPIPVVAGSPDTYTPRDFKTFRSTKKMMIEGASYAMLAVSSPSLDNEQVQENIEIGSEPWGIMENIHLAMQQLLIQSLGMTETGNTEPYDTITTLIHEWLAPDIINPSTTLLDPQVFTAFCIADWVFDIPGSSIPNTLEAHAG